MMNPIIQSPLRKLKLLSILPVFAGILYAFAVPEYKNVTAIEAQTDSVQETNILVGNISWEGNSVYTADELNKALGIKTGDTSLMEQITKQVYGPVGLLYWDKGYLFLNIQTIESKRNGATDITFKIFEGNQFKVDKIEIKGNKNVSSEEILKTITLKSGDLFNKTKLVQSHQALIETGKFIPDKIAVDVNPEPSFNEVNIVFKVVEE